MLKTARLSNIGNVNRNSQPGPSRVPAAPPEKAADSRTIEHLARILLSSGDPLENCENFSDYTAYLNYKKVCPSKKELLEYLSQATITKVNWDKLTDTPITVTFDLEGTVDRKYLAISVHYFEPVGDKKTAIYFKKLSPNKVESHNIHKAIREVVGHEAFTTRQFQNMVLPSPDMASLFIDRPESKNYHTCFYHYVSLFANKLLEVKNFSSLLDICQKYTREISDDIIICPDFERFAMIKGPEHLEVPVYEARRWEDAYVYLTQLFSMNSIFNNYHTTQQGPEFLSKPSLEYLVYFQGILHQLVKICRDLSHPDNSISSIIPAIHQLREHLKANDAPPDEPPRRKKGKKDPEIPPLGTRILALMETCFKDILHGPNQLFYEWATLLDPRYAYKPEYFTPEKWAELENRLLSKYERKVFNAMSQEFPDYRDDIHRDRAELQDSSISPLEWWSARKDSMKLLYFEARDHLFCPAVSIDAKFFFAKEGGKFSHLWNHYYMDSALFMAALNYAAPHQEFHGRGEDSRRIMDMISYRLMEGSDDVDPDPRQTLPGTGIRPDPQENGTSDDRSVDPNCFEGAVDPNPRQTLPGTGARPDPNENGTQETGIEQHFQEERKPELFQERIVKVEDADSSEVPHHVFRFPLDAFIKEEEPEDPGEEPEDPGLDLALRGAFNGPDLPENAAPRPPIDLEAPEIDPTIVLQESLPPAVGKAPSTSRNTRKKYNSPLTVAPALRRAKNAGKKAKGTVAKATSKKQLPAGLPTSDQILGDLVLHGGTICYPALPPAPSQNLYPDEYAPEDAERQVEPTVPPDRGIVPSQTTVASANKRGRKPKASQNLHPEEDEMAEPTVSSSTVAGPSQSAPKRKLQSPHSVSPASRVKRSTVAPPATVPQATVAQDTVPMATPKKEERKTGAAPPTVSHARMAPDTVPPNTVAGPSTVTQGTNVKPAPNSVQKKQVEVPKSTPLTGQGSSQDTGSASDTVPQSTVAKATPKPEQKKQGGSSNPKAPESNQGNARGLGTAPPTVSQAAVSSATVPTSVGKANPKPEEKKKTETAKPKAPESEPLFDEPAPPAVSQATVTAPPSTVAKTIPKPVQKKQVVPPGASDPNVEDLGTSSTTVSQSTVTKPATVTQNTVAKPATVPSGTVAKPVTIPKPVQKQQVVTPKPRASESNADDLGSTSTTVPQSTSASPATVTQSTVTKPATVPSGTVAKPATVPPATVAKTIPKPVKKVVVPQKKVVVPPKPEAPDSKAENLESTSTTVTQSTATKPSTVPSGTVAKPATVARTTPKPSSSDPNAEDFISTSTTVPQSTVFMPATVTQTAVVKTTPNSVQKKPVVPPKPKEGSSLDLESGTPTVPRNTVAGPPTVPSGTVSKSSTVPAATVARTASMPEQKKQVVPPRPEASMPKQGSSLDLESSPPTVHQNTLAGPSTVPSGTVTKPATVIQTAVAKTSSMQREQTAPPKPEAPKPKQGSSLDLESSPPTVHQNTLAGPSTVPRGTIVKPATVTQGTIAKTPPKSVQQEQVEVRKSEHLVGQGSSQDTGSASPTVPQSTVGKPATAVQTTVVKTTKNSKQKKLAETSKSNAPGSAAALSTGIKATAFHHFVSPSAVALASVTRKMAAPVPKKQDVTLKVKATESGSTSSTVPPATVPPQLSAQNLRIAGAGINTTPLNPRRISKDLNLAPHRVLEAARRTVPKTAIASVDPTIVSRTTVGRGTVPQDTVSKTTVCGGTVPQGTVSKTTAPQTTQKPTTVPTVSQGTVNGSTVSPRSSQNGSEELQPPIDDVDLDLPPPQKKVVRKVTVPPGTVVKNPISQDGSPMDDLGLDLPPSTVTQASVTKKIAASDLKKQDVPLKLKATESGSTSSTAAPATVSPAITVPSATVPPQPVGQNLRIAGAGINTTPLRKSEDLNLAPHRVLEAARSTVSKTMVDLGSVDPTTVSKTTVSGGTVPQGTVSKTTVGGDTVPQGTVSKTTAPQTTQEPRPLIVSNGSSEGSKSKEPTSITTVLQGTVNGSTVFPTSSQNGSQEHQPPMDDMDLDLPPPQKKVVREVTVVRKVTVPPGTVVKSPISHNSSQEPRSILGDLDLPPSTVPKTVPQGTVVRKIKVIRRTSVPPGTVPISQNGSQGTTSTANGTRVIRRVIVPPGTLNKPISQGGPTTVPKHMSTVTKTVTTVPQVATWIPSTRKIAPVTRYGPPTPYPAGQKGLQPRVPLPASSTPMNTVPPVAKVQGTPTKPKWTTVAAARKSTVAAKRRTVAVEGARKRRANPDGVEDVNGIKEELDDYGRPLPRRHARHVEIQNRLRYKYFNCAICLLQADQYFMDKITDKKTKIVLATANIHKKKFDSTKGIWFMSPNTLTYVCGYHFGEAVETMYEMLQINYPDDIENSPQKCMDEAVRIMRSMNPELTVEEVKILICDFLKAHSRLKPDVEPIIRDPAPSLYFYEEEPIIPKPQRQPRKQRLEPDDHNGTLTVTQTITSNTLPTHQNSRRSEFMNAPCICVYCSRKTTRNHMVSVPRLPERLAEWIEKLGPDFERRLDADGHNFICKNHFTVDSFLENGHLKPSAMPLLPSEIKEGTYRVRGGDILEGDVLWMGSGEEEPSTSDGRHGVKRKASDGIDDEDGNDIPEKQPKVVEL